MGNLKEDLKSAAGLLKSGANEKVIELLQGYIEEETPDYSALCFAALAYSNNSENDNSYRIFKKAIQIDEKNLMAWKGVFKLFELESRVAPDQFTLRICEFMRKNCNDKKDAAATVHRRIHVEMKLWTEISENFEILDFHKDPEILKRIVGILKDSDEKLLEKVFKASESLGILEKDGDLMLIYCKFSNSIDSVLKFVELHPDLVGDEWIQKKLLEYSCQQYFETNQCPKEVIHLENKSDVLKGLLQNDISAALEALDSVSDRCEWPESLLFVGLLAESENWESVEKTVRSIQKSFNSPFCDGWLTRCFLELESSENLKFLHVPLPEFAVEQLKIALIFEKNGEIEQLYAKFGPDSKLGVELRLTEAIFHQKTKPEDVKLSEQLPKETARDLVLTAEIRILSGLDANSLLVKAAKLNVRCSRAFFLLGKSMASKNSAKARSLIERAVNIRPGKAEYARALYEVLVRQDAPAEDRLKVLKTLVGKRKSRQKPFWLAEAFSIVHTELGNLSEAVDELQQMVRVYKDNKSVWARLADVYAQKGHLRAAVSSYQQLSDMLDGHEFTIPMIRVLIQLREFEEALEKVDEFRQKIVDDRLELLADSETVLNFTEAEIHLNLYETSCGLAKREHLKRAIKLLEKCITEEGTSKFAVVFKLLGDVLLIVSKYSERILPYFEIPDAWQVSGCVDCVTKAIAFYMTVLRSSKHDALAWYDVSVAFLAKFKLENDAKILEKVSMMLEHALSLTTTDSLLSSLWTLLAETKRLGGQPVSHQLHCLSRALQLNKANDAAWLQTAVLCLETGLMDTASRVLEQTIKYNPHNADAWCAWAQHAHLSEQKHDALAMFRQALCIRPSAPAVLGYSSYLCDSLKKMSNRFDSARVALDFEPVIDQKELSCADDRLLYHLGLLADIFGYYPESLECFQLCQQSHKEEKEQAAIKTSVLYADQIENRIPAGKPCAANSRLAGMLSLSTEDYFAFLTSEIEVYGDLFKLIETQDHVAFRSLYMSCVKEISVPLLISALITKNIDLPTEFIRTLHDALPRHELIDYFPTILPDEMDNGLRHLEQDGEEPFRYRHRAARKLLEELKLARERLESEKSLNESTDEFNHLQVSP